MDYEKIRVARFSTMEDKQPVMSTLGNMVDEIRGGTLKAATDEYRKLMALGDDAADKRKVAKKRLPAFLPSTIVKGGRKKSDIQSYTGLVMVDIDHISPEHMDEVATKIRGDAHTVMEYTTVSGCGKRIVVYVEGDISDANWITVWNGVNGYYARLTDHMTDNLCKNATRISGMCDAPDVYFNAKAQAFTLSMVTAVSQSLQRIRRRVGRPLSAETVAQRVFSMVESRGCYYVDGSHNDYIARCLYLMNKFGVSEDDATQWALREFADYDVREHSVAATAKSCFSQTSEHGSLLVRSEECGVRSDQRIASEVWATQRQSSKTHNSSLHTPNSSLKKKAQLSDITAFLDGYMLTRYNLFSNATEVKIGDKDWERLTDRIENTIWMRMHEAGINADVMQIHQLLTSEYVKEFHPLREYLNGLPPWDGKTDYIGQLAGMVHLADGEQQLFVDAFRRWLVAMIAGVLRTDIVNQTILVLIGRQGCYKTSFAQNILPPVLQRYYTMKANSQRITKDDLFTMTEYMIVNLEEIDTMPAAELNQLKAMVTQTYVDERVPYGRNKDHRAHICSFFATGNNEQFLTDETGNRRWLPFKVERIDNPWTAQIPHDLIFAQAYALYQSDFKYWFDDNEVQQLRKHVTTFETPRAEVEMILTHYRKPQGLERYSFVTSSQIVARFGTASLRLSSVKVGKAMKELGFEMERRRDSRYWKVVERTADEVNFSLPGDKIDTDLPF